MSHTTPTREGVPVLTVKQRARALVELDEALSPDGPTPNRATRRRAQQGAERRMRAASKARR